VVDEIDTGSYYEESMIKIALKTTLAATLLCGLATWAQDAGTQQGSTAPDNTQMNQRDRNASEPTADHQKENTSDRELTRQIRRAVVQDKSLSTYAHNVKIVAQNGSVTLIGPVKNEEEKTAIEQKAAQAAGGADKIHSELQVKESASDKPSASR
jgi:hyperosmotically inducible protein